MQTSGDILGLVGVATASSVDTFSDGVAVKWDGGIVSGADQCTLDVSESFKRVSDERIHHTYTLTMFCTYSSEFFSYTESCDGVLNR